MEDNVELKNRLLGITSEVGGGIVTDFATAGLLNPATVAASGGWSIVGYGAANFGQGAYNNYLVQKHLYGNENINWGEVISSGALSVIPFMNIGASAKYARFVGNANTVRRGLVGGALTGLAGEQLRVGIDEQRFLNPLEASLAAGVGGGFGGGLTHVSKKIDELKNPLKVYAAELDPSERNITGATDDLMRQQAGLRMRLLQSIDPLDSDDALMRRYTEINNPDSYVTDKLSPDYGRLKSDVTFNPRQQLELAIETPDPITARNMIKRALDNNLVTDGRLNYRAFLESNRFVQKYRRFIAGDYVTPPSKGLPYAKLTRRTQYQSRQTAFNNYRQELLEEFKAIFGDDFSRLPFNESQLDLDHKLTLVQSLGMLHNTAPGDKMWKRITEYSLRRGYTPGDAKPNLGLLDPESHRVKTNFFNDLHGLREGNMKYWNGKHRKTNKTRYEIMSESHLSDEAADLHMEVVKDYFDVVDRGDKILRDAQAIFKAEYKLNILPEEIAEELLPVILSRQYSPKNVQNAIKDIIKRNKTNFRNLEEQVDLLEFIEDFENFPKSPLTRQEYQQIDPQDIKDAKKQLRKLRRVTNRKSYIRRLIEQRERARLKSIKADEASGQLRLPIDE